MRRYLAPTPAHAKWIIDTGARQATADGKTVEIWRLDHSEDAAILSEWAAHFRQHYCPDDELAVMVAGTGRTNAEYLREVKFPDHKAAPGPSVRAGDFAEILVADFIEFSLGYWCPRVRYEDKFNRNDSTKGSDTVGFRFIVEGAVSATDELFILETKAGLTSTAHNRLQDAVDDSKKDVLREAVSLNAIKQRLLRNGVGTAESARVQRFQDEVARPFKRRHGAAAVLDDAVFPNQAIHEVVTATHPNVGNLMLIVVTGSDLMKLVHALYDRAADEA